eukprot:UN24355
MILLRNERESFKNELDLSRQDVREKNSEIKELQLKLTHTFERMEKNEIQFNRAGSKVEKIEKTNNELKEKINNLERQLDKSQHQIDNLRREKQEITKQLTTAQNVNSEFDVKKDQLRKP